MCVSECRNTEHIWVLEDNFVESCLLLPSLCGFQELNFRHQVGGLYSLSHLTSHLLLSYLNNNKLKQKKS